MVVIFSEGVASASDVEPPKRRIEVALGAVVLSVMCDEMQPIWHKA